jgi:transcriptional regulator with XRE-family HTH domain
MTVNKTIGERIRTLREEIGWNQADLATEASISTAQVSRIEQGVTDQLRTDTLVKLAKALGTTTDYILGLPDPWAWKTIDAKSFLLKAQSVSDDILSKMDGLTQDYSGLLSTYGLEIYTDRNAENDTWIVSLDELRETVKVFHAHMHLSEAKSLAEELVKAKQNKERREGGN